METPINFNEKKGFICDMDGVIYHGNRILPGWRSSFNGCMMRTRNISFLPTTAAIRPGS